MNRILQEGQAIYYWFKKAGKRYQNEIGRFTSDDELPPGLEGQLRDYQPFLDESTRYVIVPSNKEGKPRIFNARGNFGVEHRRDSIFLYVPRGTLRIQYEGIDIDKVLRDGAFRGVNKTSRDLRPKPFP